MIQWPIHISESMHDSIFITDLLSLPVHFSPLVLMIDSFHLQNCRSLIYAHDRPLAKWAQNHLKLEWAVFQKSTRNFWASFQLNFWVMMQMNVCQSLLLFRESSLFVLIHAVFSVVCTADEMVWWYAIIIILAQSDVIHGPIYLLAVCINDECVSESIKQLLDLFVFFFSFFWSVFTSACSWCVIPPVPPTFSIQTPHRFVRKCDQGRFWRFRGSLYFFLAFKLSRHFVSRRDKKGHGTRYHSLGALSSNFFWLILVSFQVRNS